MSFIENAEVGAAIVHPASDEVFTIVDIVENGDKWEMAVMSTDGGDPITINSAEDVSGYQIITEQEITEMSNKAKETANENAAYTVTVIVDGEVKIVASGPDKKRTTKKARRMIRKAEWGFTVKQMTKIDESDTGITWVKNAEAEASA